MQLLTHGGKGSGKPLIVTTNSTLKELQNPEDTAYALRLNCLSQNKLIKMKRHGDTDINISDIHSIHIFKTV